MYIVKNDFHNTIYYLFPVTYSGAEAAKMTFHIIYPYDGLESERAVLVKEEFVEGDLNARMQELENTGWTPATVDAVVYA